MIRTLGWLIGLAAVAALWTSTASAQSGTPVSLSGTQIVIDEKAGKFEMKGSLVGKWSITAFTPQYTSPSQMVAVGKERFVGCLDANRNGTCESDEAAGTLRISMTYWATFDPAKKTLLRGDCVHPILGGTGAFAKAKGAIFMKDVPTKSGIRTTYRGTLEYGAPAASSSRTLQSHSARAACGGTE